MLAALFSFVALLQPATPDPAAAKPTVKITSPTLTGAPGQLIKVEAQTTADTVTWFGSEGVSFAHPYSTDQSVQTLNAKSMLVHVSLEDAARLGTHFTIFATIPNGKLVVGDRATLDLGPPPPPQPPQPLSFIEKLQTAYEADHATLDQTSKLAAVYRLGASVVAVDPAHKTSGDILAEMQRTMKNMLAAANLPPTTLDKTRRVIADELNKTLGQNQTLTPELRAQIAKAFTAVNAALELLK